MEGSIRCEIPEDAKLLRVILQAANRLHSIALHNILILPDMYIPGTETKINPFTPEEPVRSVAKRIQRLREIGQTIGEIAGGEAVHPSNPRVGGMYKPCSDRAVYKMYDLAKEGLSLAHEQMEFMIAVIRSMQKRDWTDVGGKQIPIPKTLGYHDMGLYGVAPMYASTNLDEHPQWDPERWTDVRPWDWYMGEVEVSLADPGYPIGGTSPVGTKANPQMEACTGVPLYDGAPGRSRAPCPSGRSSRTSTRRVPSRQHVARQLEYPDCLYTIINALDQYDPSGKVLADCIPQGDGFHGLGSKRGPAWL